MKRSLVLILLSLGLLALDAGAQPPGGGGGGGGRGMMNRPSGRTRYLWMTFCFELSPTDAQVAKAWPLFRDSFARQRSLEDKYQDDPPEAARNEMGKVQTDLEAGVKAILTLEQLQKLGEQQQRMQQFRGRGPGGGGPPGGGGGGGQ